MRLPQALDARFASILLIAPPALGALIALTAVEITRTIGESPGFHYAVPWSSFGVLALALGLISLIFARSFQVAGGSRSRHPWIMRAAPYTTFAGALAGVVAEL